MSWILHIDPSKLAGVNKPVRRYLFLENLCIYDSFEWRLASIEHRMKLLEDHFGVRAAHNETETDIFLSLLRKLAVVVCIESCKARQFMNPRNWCVSITVAATRALPALRSVIVLAIKPINVLHGNTVFFVYATQVVDTGSRSLACCGVACFVWRRCGVVM